MNKIVLIFDYFKEAFHINKQNKALYKPQIALITLKALLILFVGIGIYSWIGIDNIYEMADMRSEEIFRFVFSQGLKLAALLLVYALAAVLVESGLLNMYKKAVLQGHTEAGDFKEGLSKYFVKLLLGELLIIICYIPLLPVILIVGVITLTVGLTLIPIILGVFLTMWKVSLVMNDVGVFDSIKDSFRFAKRNFIPLTLMQIIHWAFTQGASRGSGGGGGGGSTNFSLPDNTGFGSGFGEGLNESLGIVPMQEAIQFAIQFFKIAVGILIPVVTIAIVAGSIIAMIFEVFFSLALFVAYKNSFLVEAIIPATEANQDTFSGENGPDLISSEEPLSSDNEEKNDGEVEQ